MTGGFIGAQIGPDVIGASPLPASQNLLGKGRNTPFPKSFCEAGRGLFGKKWSPTAATCQNVATPEAYLAQSFRSPAIVRLVLSSVVGMAVPKSRGPGQRPPPIIPPTWAGQIRAERGSETIQTLQRHHMNKSLKF